MRVVSPIVPVAPMTVLAGLPKTRVTIRGKICERVSTSLMYCGELQVLLSSVARSSQSYTRSKGSAVLANEFLQCHRRAAADFLNQLIRPGEDTVLMIDGDFTQMLHGEGISLTSGFWFDLAIESPRVMPRRWFRTARGHHCQHRLNAHLLVSHLPPQDAAKDLGDLGISELNRTCSPCPVDRSGPIATSPPR